MTEEKADYITKITAFPRKRCYGWIKRDRRPWLRCRHCLRKLVQVDVIDGLTCIRGFDGAMITECKIICKCGATRHFQSRNIFGLTSGN
jgi:hypothetical protein